MKITYRYLTLSWCRDLTDPDGVSVPFLHLIYGESKKGERLAVFDFEFPDDPHGPPLDTFNDQMIQTTVSNFAMALENKGWGAFDWISTLRDNIHVTSLSEHTTGYGNIWLEFRKVLLEHSPLSDNSNVSWKHFPKNNSPGYEDIPCH